MDEATDQNMFNLGELLVEGLNTAPQITGCLYTVTVAQQHSCISVFTV